MISCFQNLLFTFSLYRYIAATAAGPAGDRHPDDTDDEDGSDFYFSDDEEDK